MNFFPSVLKNKNFLKLWSAQITSQIALNALYFVLALRVYQNTGGSNTAVSVLILAFTVPSIFFGYLAGVFVDHQDLKKILTITNLIRGLLILSLVLLNKEIGFVYLIVLFLAFITLFFLPAEGSALPALVKDSKDLLSANSLFTLTYQASLIIGFISAGPLLSILGERVTYFILSFFFALAFAFVWYLPNSLRSVEEKEGISGFRSSIEGLIFFFKTKSIREAIFFLTSTQAVILVLATIAPGYVDRVLNLDVRFTSIVLVAPGAVGMIVGSFLLSSVAKHSKVRTLVNIGLFLSGISFLLLSLLQRAHLNFFVYLGVVALIGFLGIATAFITIPATTELQTDTPERLRGRAYGILGTFVSGVSAIPVLLAGALGDTLGVKFVVLFMGVVSLAAGLYRLFGSRYTRNNVTDSF